MKSLIKLSVIAAVLAFSAPSLAEMTVEVGGAPMFPSKNIVENAVNSKDHTTLVAAVKAAGLVDTLAGPGPFTVFAPVNKAFDKLPAGTDYAAPKLQAALRDLKPSAKRSAVAPRRR